MIPEKDWQAKFEQRIIATLSQMLKGGPFSVVVYNNGIGGHFQVKEADKVIYTHQGKNLYSHWKVISREALSSICEHRINELLA